MLKEEKYITEGRGEKEKIEGKKKKTKPGT